MSCFHPLKAWQHPDKSISFVKSDGELKLWEMQIKDPLRYPVRPLSLPCGQCIGCRLDYSHRWAVRSLLEASTSKPGGNYFLTLTYDDEHLFDCCPHSFFTDLDTGEALFETFSLDKKELQDFMKRLRESALRKYGLDNIRFFACGEYGTKSMRPHFHLLLFNFNVPRSDLTILSTKAKSGQPLWESALVKDAWKRGFCPLGQLSYNSACYTAGYILKKHKGLDGKLYYAQRGIIPEFTVMSRRPGLAREYFEKHKDLIYERDQLDITFCNKAISPRPPKYFDDLYKAEHGEDSLSDIKDSRLQSVIDSEKVLKDKLNLPFDEYIRKREELFRLNICHGLSLTI